jgi:hypothetical protein
MEPAIPDYLFSTLLTRAAAWAQRQEELILAHERAFVLSPEFRAIARRAGVVSPKAVRILGVSEIPLPEETDLREAAVMFGLITPGTAGMTIGHGIFVRLDCMKDLQLIAHELCHVGQYERCGSILAFLQQ